jgi:hypothetical protein
MELFRSLRRQLVDSPSSIGGRFRSQRWSMLASAFPDIQSMSVIDLGGRADAWRWAPVRPGHVHVVNLETPDPSPPEWMEVDQGNACELPSTIRSRRYDLVFSNSVLEHVGGHRQRVAFAESVHALSDRHWVQTPYRYFPIEPHWLFPWFQHLPVALRILISQHWPLLHTPSKEYSAAAQAVLSVELLSKTEMKYYFPGSTIVSERIGPVSKSLIAISR